MSCCFLIQIASVPLSIILLSVCVGIGGNALCAGLLQVLKPWIGQMPDLGALIPKTLGQQVILIFAGVIGAGICEETLFRGVILSVLSRRGRRRWSIIVTAVLFGAFHLNVWQFVAGLVLGLAFGFLVERTGSLVPAMIGHASANATGGVLSEIFGERYGVEPSWLPWVISILFAFALWQTHLRTQHATTVPSPLSMLPMRATKPWLWVALGPVCLVLLIVMVRVTGIVQAHRMGTDVLAPAIQKGDVVLTISPRWYPDSIRPGDHVAYRFGDRTLIRRVLKTDAITVTVLDGDDEHPVARVELLGKVVHTIHLPKPPPAPP